MSSDDAATKAPRDGQSQVFGRATISRNEILRHLAQGKEVEADDSRPSGITINDVQAYINKSINRKSKMILYRSAAVFGLILVIVQMFCTFGVAVWANETSRQVYVEDGATNLTNGSGTTLGTTTELSMEGASLLDVHGKIEEGNTIAYVGGELTSQDHEPLVFEVNVAGYIKSDHWTSETGALLNQAEEAALEAKIAEAGEEEYTCVEEAGTTCTPAWKRSCYDMYTDLPGMKMVACEDSFTVIQGDNQYSIGSATSRRRMGIMISKYGISTSSRGRPGGMRRWAFRYGWNGLRMPYRRPNLVAGELSCADISAAMSTETYSTGDLSHIDTSHMSQDAMDMGGRRRLAEDEAEGTRRRLMRMCGSGSMGGHKVNAKATGNWYKAQEAFLGYSITDSSMYGRRVNAITVGVAAVNSSGGAPSTDEVQKYANKADALVTHNIPAIIEAAADNGRNAMHIDGMCVDCSAGGNNCIIATCI